MHPRVLQGQALQYSKQRQRSSRTYFTRGDLNLLESIFKTTVYPDRVMRAAVAIKIDKPESCIRTWFQNRRMKYREETNLSNSVNTSNSTSEASMVGPNCRQQPPNLLLTNTSNNSKSSSTAAKASSNNRLSGDVGASGIAGIGNGAAGIENVGGGRICLNSSVLLAVTPVTIVNGPPANIATSESRFGGGSTQISSYNTLPYAGSYLPPGHGSTIISIPVPLNTPEMYRLIVPHYNLWNHPYYPMIPYPGHFAHGYASGPSSMSAENFPS